MRLFHVAAALPLVLACGKKAPPMEQIPSSTPTASVAPSASASAKIAPTAATVDSFDAGPRSPTKVTKDATPPVHGESPFAVARMPVPEGSLVVWSELEGKGSRILAGFEKEPGTLSSPAKLLRSTSGEVGAIALVSDEKGDIFVAWASGLGDGKGQLVAFLTTSNDLSQVSQPTTIGVVPSEVKDRAHLAIARNPRGGFVIVHEGPSVHCRPAGPEPDDMCLTFEAKWIAPRGGIARLGKGQVEGGPSPEYHLLDLEGRALLVYASSMRGGRTMATAVLPYGPEDAVPRLTPPLCQGMAAFMPEIVRTAAGEIVALCMDGRPDKGACISPIRGEKDRCLRIAVTGKDGKAKVSDAPVLKAECSSGGAQRLIYAEGSAELLESSSHASDFMRSCGKSSH